jgi:hypothetical protein
MSHPPPGSALSPDPVEGLVAPIALYPDPVLSQVLVAATYPLEVVEASLLALAQSAAHGSSQRSFATPKEAVQATIEAAEHNDTAALLQIFGPEGRGIVLSGEIAEDKDRRTEFARAAHEKLELEKDPLMPDKVSFTVGGDEWPFPVPVVRKDGKWQLDSARGRLEILARRIGRNELTAMEVCRGYAEAQFEYAATAHDGDSLLKYAQRAGSTPGKKDGLDDLVSPSFAGAFDGSKKLEAYHGYYFHLQKSQGPDSPGGAFNYVVNGKMIGGFALIAWPAEYGVSGILTLIINHDGVVFEKDLGASTAAQSRLVTRFNPDKTWRAAVLE